MRPGDSRNARQGVGCNLAYERLDSDTRLECVRIKAL
jgi:hypothetical protein